MATFTKSVKLFIDDIKTGTAPSTFGFRAQQTAVPAITYSVLQNNPATISTLGMGFASIEVTFIAQSAEEADAAAALFEEDLPVIEKTYDTITFHTVISQHYVLNQPTQGAGDEAEPYSATLYLDIYYERLY